MIKLSFIIQTFFLDTISPLSEQSLSSPVEDGGGYQSEVRITPYLKEKRIANSATQLRKFMSLLNMFLRRNF